VTAKPLYSIESVAAMIGSTPAALRSWEERYGVVHPERSGGGRSMYTRDQVEELRFVRRKLEEGLSEADAHQALEERLRTRRGGPGARERDNGRPLLVLLAEGDPYAADLSEFFLRTEGHEVELATSTEDAEAKFRRREPQLVIVDLLISGGAGAALCARLKALAPVPVLAISSLQVRDEALAAGADAFLEKPIDPLALVSAVKDMLGESALVRSAVPVE
jgi:CheY-like chemotaxis protein